MNKEHLSKIPVSELSEADKEVLMGPKAAKEPRRKKYTSRQMGLMAVVAVIVVGGLGAGIYFLLRRPAKTFDDENVSRETAPITLEVVEVKVDEERQPSQEYIAELRAKLDNPETSVEERFSTQISLANAETDASHFAEVETQLNAIERDGLTQRQLYALYDAYTYLYKRAENEEKQVEYAELREKILNEAWDGE
ncbi:hypothetical protein IKF74_03005 [Candidatus Saccharibacteria bacterium]|nr:hypothetical protein [Candidatus Saccharibacteria bacterium]